MYNIVSPNTYSSPNTSRTIILKVCLGLASGDIVTITCTDSKKTKIVARVSKISHAVMHPEETMEIIEPKQRTDSGGFVRPYLSAGLDVAKVTTSPCGR